MLKALHLPGGGGGGGLVVYQLSGEAAEGGGGDGGGKRRRKVALLFVTADKTVAQRALARAAPPGLPGPHARIMAHRERWMLPSPFCSRKSLQQRQSMQASRQRIARQLLAGGGSGGKRRVAQDGYRCFSSSVRQNQQQPPKSRPQDEAPQTTHFGFETIAEALKEQRGNHFTHSSTL